MVVNDQPLSQVLDDGVVALAVVVVVGGVTSFVIDMCFWNHKVLIFLFFFVLAEIVIKFMI